MFRPGGLSALYTLRMPPLFCARAPPPVLTVISTPITAASKWRLRGISVSPIRCAARPMRLFPARHFAGHSSDTRLVGRDLPSLGVPAATKFERSRPADRPRRCGCCRIGQATLAGTHGNGREAPIPDARRGGLPLTTSVLRREE